MSSRYTKVSPVESGENILGGSLEAVGIRLGIVVSRFNSHITDKLLEGARKALIKYNIAETDTVTVWVPGAFELPIVAKKIASSGKYSAIVCLGAVIKGDTSHFDFVCTAAMEGILQVGLDSGIPVIFGVLTCDSDEQAKDRCKNDESNKGFEAVETAIWTANSLTSLSS